jgi:hypothetical protein
MYGWFMYRFVKHVYKTPHAEVSIGGNGLYYRIYAMTLKNGGRDAVMLSEEH